MIKKGSTVVIRSLPLHSLHVVECKTRYIGRVLHYFLLMRRFPHDDAGIVCVQPSTLYTGLYEILDGHHRFCAAICAGRTHILCAIITNPV